MKRFLWILLYLAFLGTAVLVSCRKESDEELLADDSDLLSKSSDEGETASQEETKTTGDPKESETVSESNSGTTESGPKQEDPEHSLDCDQGISREALERYRVLAQDSQAVYYLSDSEKANNQYWSVSEGRLTVSQTSPVFIWRGDKATGESAPICQKEGCTHKDKDCDAAFYADGILGLSLYDGEFYWAVLETGKDHEDGIGVYRMRKDGTGRAFLGAVPMYAFGFSEDMFTSEWTMENRWEFPDIYFHRGYLYIVTKILHFREDRFAGGMNVNTLKLSVYAVSLQDFHESHELFSGEFEEYYFCTTELCFDEEEAVLAVWEQYADEETGRVDYRVLPPRLSVYRMGLGLPRAKLLYQGSDPNAYPSLFVKDGRALLLMSVRDTAGNSEAFYSETALFEVDEEFASLRKLLSIGSGSIRFANGYLIGIENSYSAASDSGDSVRLHIYDLYGQELHAFAFDPDRVTVTEDEPGSPYPNICISDADAFYGYNPQLRFAEEKGFFYMVPLTGSEVILFEPEGSEE